MLKRFTISVLSLLLALVVYAQDCENYFLNQQNDTLTFTFRGFMVDPGQTLYDWDFGDGSTGSGKVVTHTFPQGVNTYEVCLFTQTFDTAGNICYDTSCQMITVGNAPGCVAFFFGSASQANPLAWSFTDFSSGSPTSWSWDFGDGTTSSQQNPVHTFAEAGEYEVCLTIVNSVANCDDQYCEVITVTSNAGWDNCESDFTYYSGDLLTFDFTGFMLDTTQPATYFWEFGDGTTGSGQEVTHTYSPTGTEQYLVCLTTRVPFPNGDTCVYSICHSVIAGSTPECQALYNWAFGSQPLTIVFSDLSLGNPNKWSWSFGDDTYSQQQNPTHTYPDVGIYEVCLTITNDTNGCTSEICMDVNVSNAPPPVNCTNVITITQGSDIYTYDFHGEAFSDGVNVSSQSTFTWNLGDGTTLSGQDQNHIYTSPGTYVVTLGTLSVLNGTDTCTSNSSDTIIITDQSLCLGGYVRIDSATTADAAIVHLLTFDSQSNALLETETTSIDANGYYLFEGLNPQGGEGYLLQAELSQQSIYYGQFVPTYHLDAIHWENALEAAAEECPPVENNRIRLQAATAAGSGSGTISGVIYNNDTREIIENVEVLLFNESMQPLMYDHSDGDGAFGFSSLEMGSYYVYPEMVGITTEGFMVTLSEETPDIEMNIIIMNGTASLSVEEFSAISFIGNLYPNPAASSINITLTAESSVDALISIYNQLGQEMMIQDIRLQKGMNKVELNIGKLPESVYYLRISSNDSRPLLRSFIKTR
ncbi:MAG TPA: PKD domain-containing protein [Bacteroidales bacterium]|nr:PKD domain-containing protein [Bacteroidales bacterium]